MELWSEDRQSCLSLEVTESDFIEYPSLALSVAVKEEGFCEARSSAWVSLKDYIDFVDALRQCEQVRRGRASLASMSPGEAEITLENSDALGHFHLTYRLGKTSFSGRTGRTLTVMGEFDLNSKFFAQTVSEFADLLPASVPG